MKKKIGTVLRVIAFFCLAAILLSAINNVLHPVWFTWNNHYTTKGIYEEPRNTLETIFLGASVMGCGISPTQLYENYGICSYNMGSEQQPMLTSYYWLQEVYRLHKDTLKVAVLDISLLRNDPKSAFYHKALDNMRLSPVKVKAAWDYTDHDFEDTMNYLFPFLAFHDRWSTLKTADYTNYKEDPINGTRGYIFYSETRGDAATLDVQSVKNITVHEDAKPAELVEMSVEYFHKIVAFCQEKGITLIPIRTVANNWNEKLHVATKALTDQYGLEFYDFNFSPYYEQMEFVPILDRKDGAHMNYYGSYKLTEWFGKFLTEQCGVRDVRGEEKYAYMEEHVALFNKNYKHQMDLKSTEKLVDYVKTAMEGDYTTFICVKDEAAKNLSKEARAYFAEIGLEKLSKLAWRESYIAVIEGDKVVYELVQAAGNNKDYKDPLTYEHKLPSGKTYTLQSGGRFSKNIASCIGTADELMVQGRGLNFVVIRNEDASLVDSTCFDTNVSSKREVYSATKMEEVKQMSASQYEPGGLYAKLRHQSTLNEMTKRVSDEIAQYGDDGLLNYLRDYMERPNTTILIAAKDEASLKLFDKVKDRLEDMGLETLSKLGFRDAYVGMIENGKVVYEATGPMKVPLVYENGIFYLESIGSSIKADSYIRINGDDYCLNKRGLNFVIYDNETNSVIGWNVFDTYDKAQTIW